MEEAYKVGITIGAKLKNYSIYVMC